MTAAPISRTNECSRVAQRSLLDVCKGPPAVTLSPDQIGTKGLQLFLERPNCRFFAARRVRAPLRMTPGAMCAFFGCSTTG